MTDLVAEQTIWCKETILPSFAVSHRACVKIKGTTIWAGVNPAASSVAGTLSEVDTLVYPAQGWNHIAVGFDTSPTVSRV